MVKIISDSTCDLSAELIARYDIDVLPLHIVLGEEDFEDGRGISPDEIYQWSDMHRQSPKTAACSLADAMAALEPYVSAGREVIVFSISSSMSSTYSVLCMAAEQLDASHLVTVIDSKNLSTGVGLQVIEAAEMERIRKMLNELLADATGKDVSVIEKDTDRNNYMDALSAKEYGLVDKVLGKRE